MKGGEETAENYKKMTETPVPKLIISLAIPTTITMLITNIYNLADTYFVSKLGTSASAAIGIVYALMAILQAIGFLLGQGAGSNISRRLGAKDYEGANKFASTSFFIALSLGIIVAIFGIIFIDPFMMVLGSTETILPYSRIYGRYILLAAPAMIISFVMNNILRFEGKASLAMIGITTGGILNIIGDPIFMFKFNMGIAGAGLSTALSQYISAGILFGIFYTGRSQSKIAIKNITKNISDIINILKTGTPSLVRQGLGSISTMLLNQSAAVYGDGAVAAMSIVSRCCMFLFSVGLGIGQGFQPVAAFNYGAKKYSRVKKGFFFTLIFGICTLGTLSLLGIIFSNELIGVFSNEQEIINIGVYALKAQLLALFIIPISVCGNMLFQSIGKSGRATFLSTFRSGLFLIPLLIILPNIMGIKGIQLAQPISDILSSICTIPFVAVFLKNMPKE